MPGTRLDIRIVELGLAATRSRAKDAVLRGAVTIDGATERRPGATVAEDALIRLADPAGDYVSRAALKLIAGLDHFGFDPQDQVALDLGASTGGFTQVLLERGAEHVVAVDVGCDQLAPALRDDPRVTSIEGLNARDLDRAHLGGRAVNALVADLSFISLTLALLPTLALAEPGSWGLFLVKPQFEAGRDAIGRDGHVAEPVGRAAAERIAAWVDGRDGWRSLDLHPSPIAGGKGAVEYLLGARRDA